MASQPTKEGPPGGRDTAHRYAPTSFVRGGKLVRVAKTVYHPAGHPHTPIKGGVLELVTDQGSRFFGCDRAYINGELRMVAIGCDTCDAERMGWPIVPPRNRDRDRRDDGAAKLDAFTRAYIECMLWASTDNGYLGEGHPDNEPEGEQTGGNPLDDHFGIDDLAPDALATCVQECADFRAYCRETGISLDGWTDDEAGHDFWLTRNGLGAGFWDRGRPAGEALSKAAKAFGSCDAYVGDDGKVYVS